MALSVPLDLVPMESEAIDELPAEKGWQFEPKWDGFRALAFRDGDTVHLQSRNQKPLGRYFPELVDALHSLPVKRFVLDGEILILGYPFETLQLRLHPAATRIALLARQYPATFVAFDLLADVRGRSLLPQPFAKRREALEKFLGTVGETSSLMLSPATRDPEKAREWLHTIGDGLDGIVAKPLEAPYRPGERLMRKFKLRRSYDCVVAGLYFLRGTRIIDSVLLGLYDDQGLLHYVGRFRVTKDMDAAGMDKLLRPLSGGSGFTGRSPSGKNRWSGKEREAISLKPVLVAEVTADHITSQHIRHGAKFVRWRGDKRPEACTLDQLERASAA